MSDSSNIIAFQGVLGAYSHMACQAVKPEMEVLACASFEDMILAVQEGRAARRPRAKPWKPRQPPDQIVELRIHGRARVRRGATCRAAAAGRR